MAQSQSVPAQPAISGRKALVGALILGAIAAGLIVAVLASRDSNTPAAPVVAEPVSVVFALQDIPAGTTITADMLEERLVPPELVVSGAFTDLTDVEGVVARSVVIAPPGPERDALRMIADGRRTFRHDTFGDEAKWTDQLRMHEVVRTAVDPLTALSVGLKVDLDALPPSVTTLTFMPGLRRPRSGSLT